MSVALLLCLFAPAMSQAGEGGGYAPTIQSWIVRLDDEDVTVREAAVQALTDKGEPAVASLVEAIRAGSSHQRAGAAEALRRMGPVAAGAAQPLLVALRADEEEIAASAAHALGGIGRDDASIVNTLLDAIRSWSDYEFAAQALARIGGPAIPAIVDALVIDNRPFRLRLLHHVLSQMGPEAMDAIPALILLRQTNDVELAQSAEEVLHGTHPDREQTIAALTRSLESPNWQIRLLCVRQLGGHGSNAASAGPGLARRLAEDELSAIRKAAAQAVSYVAPESPNTFEALANALNDTEIDVVLMVAATLGAIGAENPDAARALEAHLFRPDPVGEAVEVALVQCGGNAVPSLVRGLGSRQKTVRMRAAHALGEIGTVAADAVPMLIHVMEDDAEEVRTTAEEALGRLGAVGVPALAAALQRGSHRVQLFAARALGDIGPDAAAAVDALAAALKDRDVEMREAAARALGRVGEPAAPAAGRLLKSLRDKDPGVRSASAVALGALGVDKRSVVKGLVRAIQDRDEAVGCAAVEALGRLGPGAAIAARDLLRCLRDAPIEVRWRSAQALGRIAAREKPVLKGLIRALHCTDWRVQKYAAVALGALGPYAAEAREDLEKLADSRVEVREAAREALKRIANP